MRFPHLSDDIFGELDYKSLIKFREVSKFWSKNIHEQRIYWIRKIEQCTEKNTEFNKEWKIVVRKRPIRVLKLIEEVTRTLRDLPRSSQTTSPLHIAAKFHLGLFKIIAPKFEDKNPANSFGDTPLLCAVKIGHSDICSYIIDNVDENKKNPADQIGFTPLHYAAILNNLKIYKLIADKVEDKHPQDNMGITPLHIAVQNGNLDRYMQFCF
jgi:ankyrin repeat protein